MEASDWVYVARVRGLAVQAAIAAGMEPSRADWHKLTIAVTCGQVLAPWEAPAAAIDAAPTPPLQAAGAAGVASDWKIHTQFSAPIPRQ